eukprot:5709268-Pyramimonas_sp.AAC.1
MALLLRAYACPCRALGSGTGPASGVIENFRWRTEDVGKEGAPRVVEGCRGEGGAHLVECNELFERVGRRYATAHTSVSTLATPIDSAADVGGRRASRRRLESGLPFHHKWHPHAGATKNAKE